jgi:hypothetical protein
LELDFTFDWINQEWRFIAVELHHF